MPQPSEAELKAQSVKDRIHDLQNLTFRWKASGPHAVAMISSFTPEDPYFVRHVKLNVFTSLGNVTNSILVSVNVGFSSNVAALTAPAGVGNSIVDEVDSSMREFLNFDPDGFYLPRGKTLYLMSSAQNIVAPPAGTPATAFQVFGTVVLYMRKTRE